MEQQETIIIEGPLHPDLFGGETPIMTAVPVEEAGRFFRVHVEYMAPADEILMVVALDANDAEKVARAIMKDEYGSEVEIEDVEVTEAPNETPPPYAVSEFVGRLRADRTPA